MQPKSRVEMDEAKFKLLKRTIRKCSYAIQRKK